MLRLCWGQVGCPVSAELVVAVADLLPRIVSGAVAVVEKMRDKRASTGVAEEAAAGATRLIIGTGWNVDAGADGSDEESVAGV